MRDILEEADDLKTRMKEEGRWPPLTHEQQTVNRLMAKCPDSPPRELVSAMLALAYHEGKVEAVKEVQASFRSMGQ
jgi:hypothetical protein